MAAFSSRSASESFSETPNFISIFSSAINCSRRISCDSVVIGRALKSLTAFSAF
jgi:hypothetical protein